MARIRTIKPEFFTSADIVALSPLARLLFIGLWGIADREGRMKWRPADFKLQILPGDQCDIEALCAELTGRGLIACYGKGLAVIPSFTEHQAINPRELKSMLPAPTDADIAGTDDDASSTRADACARVDDIANPDVTEGKGREGKGKERNRRDERASRATTIPDDWQPDAELVEYARAHGCSDAADTFEKFRLHHGAKGTKHKNWRMAAQLWCRNEHLFHGKPDPPKPKAQGWN